MFGASISNQANLSYWINRYIFSFEIILKPYANEVTFRDFVIDWIMGGFWIVTIIAFTCSNEFINKMNAWLKSLKIWIEMNEAFSLPFGRERRGVRCGGWCVLGLHICEQSDVNDKLTNVFINGWRSRCVNGVKCEHFIRQIIRWSHLRQIRLPPNNFLVLRRVFLCL